MSWIAVVLALQVGLAQEPPPLPDIPDEDGPSEPAPEEAAPEAPAPEPAPPVPAPLATNEAPPPPPPASSLPRRTYELSLRSRYVSLPRGLMDLFLIGARDSEWPLPGRDRPAVLGYSLGLEFGFVQKETTILGFYVEYIGSLIEEGYWDDRDDPPDGRDGDWLRPTAGFGAIAVAFNGFYDAPIVDNGQTRNRFELSFYVGGGIGLAALVGGIDQWELDASTGRPAYQQALNGEAPDGRVAFGSPVWPMVDFELGFRMLFAEYVLLRLGGGIHDGLSVGGNLGARF